MSVVILVRYISITPQMKDIILQMNRRILFERFFL